MAVINITEGRRRAGEHELWAARGRAIQGYAGLEEALCQLFASCADLRYDVAVTIYHKLNSKPQRDVLRDLLKLKFSNTYDLFWKSAFKYLESLATKRNHIVHWSALAVINVDGDGSTTADVHLKPANQMPHQFNDGDRLTADDMKAFEAQCDFWAQLIHIFTKTNGARLDAEADFDKAAWVSVFTHALTYPPAENHPQIRLLSGLLRPL